MPMSEHPRPLYDAVHKIKCADLNVNQEIVTIRQDDVVETAVNRMAKAKVLSLPVMDKDNKCIGLIDMTDVVFTVLKVSPSLKELSNDKVEELARAGRAMALEPLEKALGVSGRDPFIPVFEKSPVSELVELFAKGVHRSPIMDADNKIIGTISQSSVVDWLANNLHIGELKTIAPMTAQKLGLGQQPVITVSKDASVLEVLQVLWKNQISAVALVEGADAGGKLAGTFSVTNLQGLFSEKQQPSLNKPVIEFLKEHYPNSLNSVVCRNDTGVQEICKEMVKNHIHRMWLVDNDFKPIGVVSATDIMKLVNDFVF